MLRLICGHAPQNERYFEKCKHKLQSFYKLKGELDIHSADDLVTCLIDLNGHIGRHIDGLDGLLGGYGIVQRNLEVIILLVLSGEGIMCVKYMI